MGKVLFCYSWIYYSFKFGLWFLDQSVWEFCLAVDSVDQKFKFWINVWSVYLSPKLSKEDGSIYLLLWTFLKPYRRPLIWLRLCPWIEKPSASLYFDHMFASSYSVCLDVVREMVCLPTVIGTNSKELYAPELSTM